jgi:hypothetical protein
MATPSLRAQRGNPDFGAATGLPRRCAPRNDGRLRGFAALCETNLLIASREAAKEERHLRAGEQIARMRGKKCPQCAEVVKEQAKVCRFCSHEFPEARLAS